MFYFRYQQLMAESSKMPLFDLRKLNASLPDPSVTRSCVDVFVLGASDDFIVVKPTTQSMLFEEDNLIILSNVIPIWNMFLQERECYILLLSSSPSFFLSTFNSLQESVDVCRMLKGLTRQRGFLGCRRPSVWKGLHMTWCWIVHGRKVLMWSCPGFRV